MISQLDRDIVFHSKKTLLFNNGAPWSKKQSSNGLFDITMGSDDGAEACELVVCFLLSQLNKEFNHKISLSLYRDDGLAAVYGTSREIQIIQQKIRKIFQDNGLKITIEANQKSINYIDVTLNLQTEKHQPYIKPGNTPSYINNATSRWCQRRPGTLTGTTTRGRGGGGEGAQSEFSQSS